MLSKIIKLLFRLFAFLGSIFLFKKKASALELPPEPVDVPVETPTEELTPKDEVLLDSTPLRVLDEPVLEQAPSESPESSSDDLEEPQMRSMSMGGVILDPSTNLDTGIKNYTRMSGSPRLSSTLLP